MISKTLFEQFYPDKTKDGAAAFYSWIRRYLNSDSVVLNLGAGPPANRDPVRIIKGEVRTVVGADIDPDVLDNPELDEAHVIKDAALPFARDSFDLVFCDWVLEHVESPPDFLAEVHRVLKPRGSLFFRTPNKYHYVVLISRVTPHRFHVRIANWARAYPTGQHEPWPTLYRLNTKKDILRTVEATGFAQVELLMWEYEPLYLKFHSVPFLIGVCYERLVNRYELLAPFRASILGRLVK